MAQTVHKDPNTVAYDSTPVVGVQSIQYSETDTPQTLMSDDGDPTHFVIKGAVRGSIVCLDMVEAAKLSKKVADAKNLTFKVNDAADADAGTVTITGFKSGGVGSGFGPGASPCSVAFVADSVSVPT